MLKWGHMDPNQFPAQLPPQPPQPAAQPPSQGTPLDYLDQIAPQQQKHALIGALKPIHYIIGGVVIVLLLVLVIGLAFRGGTSTVTNMQHLMARLKTTTTIASKADQTIKSGSLSVINTNLDIYLANTNRDIATSFKELGVTSANIDPAITKAENGAALSARLEDARLNAVFDSTYAREMSYLLATIMTLMKTISQSTNNVDIKAFLQSAYTNLQPTQQSFDSFSTTTE